MNSHTESKTKTPIYTSSNETVSNSYASPKCSTFLHHAQIVLHVAKDRISK